MHSLSHLSKLVDLARSQGARAAEVYAFKSEGHRLRLSASGNVAHQNTAADQLTVRVWVDAGRVGVQTGKMDQADDLIGQALASTFESPENPHAGPVEQVGTIAGGLGVLDRRHQRLELSDRREALEDAARQAEADDRFERGTFFYDDALTWRGFCSSRGVSLEEQGSRFVLRGSLSGPGFELNDFEASRSFASVASIPIGTRLVQRAEALMQEGETLPPGPVRVVLPPLPMARVLMALGDHFTLDELARGRFMLQHEGERSQLSPELHLLDDGAMPAGLRTRGFDDRGCFTVPVVLLREGQVAGFFLEPDRARRLDTQPTGHVHQDALRCSNLVMRGGTRSINALLTEIKGESLMLDDLDLSGLDVKTGAFKAKVDGVVMHANKPVGAMRGVTIKGNLFDLLSNVVQLCNNTDRIGYVDAASIIADGLELV